MLLRSEGSLAPIEKTIRTTIRTVHVVAASFDAATIEPFGTIIGDMIAVRVAQFPNMRRRSDVDATVVDKNAFGQR